jgi:hypothetical protein
MTGDMPLVPSLSKGLGRTAGRCEDAHLAQPKKSQKPMIYPVET